MCVQAVFDGTAIPIFLMSVEVAASGMRVETGNRDHPSTARLVPAFDPGCVHSTCKLSCLGASFEKLSAAMHAINLLAAADQKTAHAGQYLACSPIFPARR